MPSVLIIEGDDELRSTLQAQLVSQGISVSSARQGEEGLARAIEQKPDLIIMDALLQDAAGVELCSRLRETEATKLTPIILMSGQTPFPETAALGAHVQVSKPVKIIELGELVDRYVVSKPASRPPGGSG